MNPYSDISDAYPLSFFTRIPIRLFFLWCIQSRCCGGAVPIFPRSIWFDLGGVAKLSFCWSISCPQTGLVGTTPSRISVSVFVPTLRKQSCFCISRRIFCLRGDRTSSWHRSCRLGWTPLLSLLGSISLSTLSNGKVLTLAGFDATGNVNRSSWTDRSFVKLIRVCIYCN